MSGRILVIDDEQSMCDLLEEGLVVQSVTRREVRLGPQRSGPSTVELVLPVVED